ncbi:MAG TPA: hypothetical protein VMB51_04515 [Solirubrobacteraceae bacterium]|nr:hypothetical protein [Solirubrobacteraceae bacterium]
MAIDEQALRAAAVHYASARHDCRVAEDAARAAYLRLEASPDTLEYQIAYSEARKREAATALRKRRAQETYLLAGGYSEQDPAAQ